MCSWELWCNPPGMLGRAASRGPHFIFGATETEADHFPPFKFQKRTRIFRGEQKTARTSVLNLVGPSRDKVYLVRRRSNFFFFTEDKLLLKADKTSVWYRLQSESSGSSKHTTAWFVGLQVY